MSEALRRYQRFIVTPGVLLRQRIKSAGILAAIRGWSDCFLQDISQAGALIFTRRSFDRGDYVVIDVSPDASSSLRFTGEVMNVGRDGVTGMIKLGVRLDAPPEGSQEHSFLHTLESRFTAVK